MKTIKKMIKDKVPFAIVKYYEYAKHVHSHSQAVYEHIYIDSRNNQIAGYVINNFDVKFLDELVINGIMQIVIRNNDGCVYEFMNFKEFKERKQIDHKKFI